jgi:hypothetical protein
MTFTQKKLNMNEKYIVNPINVHIPGLEPSEKFANGNIEKLAISPNT